MSRYDKICSCCSAHYMYCPTCKSYANLPRWMNSFCSEECKDIFHIAMDYHAGNMSKDNAKKELQKLNIAKVTAEGIKKIIDKIMGTDAVVMQNITEEVKVEESPVVEESVVDEPVADDYYLDEPEESIEETVENIVQAEEAVDATEAVEIEESEPVVAESTEEDNSHRNHWRSRFGFNRR